MLKYIYHSTDDLGNTMKNVKKAISRYSFISLLLWAGFCLCAYNAIAGTQPYIGDHQINFGTGNKYLAATDVKLASPGIDLTFTRTYNSQSDEFGPLGYGWTGGFSEKLTIGSPDIILAQPGGRAVHFIDNGSGQWINETGKERVITQVADDYQLKEPNGTVKLFGGIDSNKLLKSVTDKNGNSLTYTYTGVDLKIENNFGRSLEFDFNDQSGQLDSVTSSFNGTSKITSYLYDSNINLITVTKPDGTSINYSYGDPLDTHNLTGIEDEEGKIILTVGYDVLDRVTSSVKGDSASEQNKVTIAYTAYNKREITNSLGVLTTYTLEIVNGIVMVESIEGVGCSSCSTSSDTSYVYDDRGRVILKTVSKDAADLETVVTEYTYGTTYDAEGLRKDTITEALGTVDWRTTDKYFSADNLLKKIITSSIASTGDSVVTLTYDSNGNLLSKKEDGFDQGTAITRTTSTPRNSDGRITTINGPRDDIVDGDDTVDFSYYPNDSSQGLNQGQLFTITNALGHVTTYSNYNFYGEAETITAANGLVTTRVYNADNGRLESSTTGGIVTTHTYYDDGKLKTSTSPGSGGNYVITYVYSADGQLQTISDNLQNSIKYFYDSEGRVERTEVWDEENSSLTRYLDTEYIDENLVSENPDAVRRTTTVYPELVAGRIDESIADYDKMGNLVETINSSGFLKTIYAYDNLNRLKNVIEKDIVDTTVYPDHVPDLDSIILYHYDKKDNLLWVMAADGEMTNFVYDDFGRRQERDAPDTGLTTYDYDKADNLISFVDAKGQTISFEYDALNRLANQKYPMGATEQVISLQYDLNGPNGIGKLGLVTDEEGSRSFSYNSLGQLTNEIRILGTTTYTTSYLWDSTTGQLDSMTYPGTGGSAVSYSRDLDGQITAVTLEDATPISLMTTIQRKPFGPLTNGDIAGSTTLTKTVDERYNVSRIQAGLFDSTYTRDGDGHVTEISNLPPLTVADESIAYTYNINTNQLASFTGNTPKIYAYDDNGNITSDGLHTFIYDALNRLIQVDKNSAVLATYAYDSSNRRVRKTTGGVTIHYHYDLNNQLISETSTGGTILREYFYLDGEPLALREYENNAGLYYYINDHLGTPQQLIDGLGNIVWQAAYLPFGEAQVGTESVVSNIRFPGQYFDGETGLHYNWNRYYDPATGRYISADPIGLQGGINLYAYVGGNPINFFDPTGESLLDIGKCLYLGRKIQKLKEKCRKEIGHTAEDQCYFMDKYDASFLSEAIMNCVRAKDPDLYSKWAYACIKSPYPGPKPSPRPKP